jgi:hypothetical protein
MDEPKNEKRYTADCRLMPSESNCSLTMSGSHDELMDAAIDHDVKAHGHVDTPEFREEVRSSLKLEEV